MSDLTVASPSPAAAPSFPVIAERCPCGRPTRGSVSHRCSRHLRLDLELADRLNTRGDGSQRALAGFTR